MCIGQVNISDNSLIIRYCWSESFTDLFKKGEVCVTVDIDTVKKRILLLITIRVLFFNFLLAAKVQSTKGTVSGCGSINLDGVGILSRNIYSSMFCNEVCYFHLNNLPVISLCFYFTQHFSLLSCILAVDLFFVVVSAGYTPFCKLLFPKPNSLWKTGYFSLLLPSFFPPSFPLPPQTFLVKNRCIYKAL